MKHTLIFYFTVLLTIVSCETKGLDVKQCEPGWVLTSNGCRQRCLVSDDCGAGTSCIEDLCIPCVSDGQCLDNLKCDVQSGECFDICEAHEHCTYGYYCTIDNNCLPKLNFGEECVTDGDCESNECNGYCRLAFGSECAADNQCPTDFCTDGYCCTSRCHEGCESCDSDGVCSAVISGTDPECPTLCTETGCRSCPEDMEEIEDFCMDKFEAPGQEGELPFVMFTFLEAEQWCESKGKRLCFDSEWTLACGTAQSLNYPYGDTHVPGTCNDNKTWRPYNQDLLNLWPIGINDPSVATLEELLTAARSSGVSGTSAADHIEQLYQGAPSGTYIDCVNTYNIYDLCGNVEEWTRRSDGGVTDFHGNLKGRYWADSRQCGDNIKDHGDSFRFYEIGFRCCSSLWY